jgi:hypothetical protein
MDRVGRLRPSTFQEFLEKGIPAAVISPLVGICEGGCAPAADPSEKSASRDSGTLPRVLTRARAREPRQSQSAEDTKSPEFVCAADPCHPTAADGPGESDHGSPGARARGDSVLHIKDSGRFRRCHVDSLRQADDPEFGLAGIRVHHYGRTGWSERSRYPSIASVHRRERARAATNNLGRAFQDGRQPGALCVGNRSGSISGEFREPGADRGVSIIFWWPDDSRREGRASGGARDAETGWPFHGRPPLTPGP